MTTARLFVCAKCGQIIISERSKKEVLAEMHATFAQPITDADRLAVLCDGCYAQFVVWARKAGLLKSGVQ